MDTDAEATPSPEAPKKHVKKHAPEESAEEQLAQGVKKALAPLIGRFAPWLLAGVGGVVGVGGITTNTSADSHYQELKAAIDKLGIDQGETRKELVEVRKELAERRALDAAAVARAQAERHEDRLRELEKQAQASILERSALRLEVEALKKAGAK